MSAFSLNCSVPPNVVNYVSPANARGTLDILWVCLSVLVLCTWTIQHLSVPAQIRPYTETQKWRLSFYLLFRKVKWMILTVIAPECLLGKALVDLLSAWCSCDEMKVLAERDKIEWTIKHAYLANIGGFGLLFDDSVTKKTEGPTIVGEPHINSAPSNGRERVSESPLAKCDNTVLPGAVSGYTENLSPLYRNARLLAQQSYASMQLLSLTEDGSPAPVMGEDSTTHAAADSKSPTARVARDRQRPQGHNSCPETAISVVSEEAKVVSVSSPRHGPTALHECNEDCVPIDSLGRKLGFPSRRCGTEDWSPNDINRRLVMRGMQKLGTQGQSLHLMSRQRNLMALQGSIWILDARQLRLARELGVLARLPHIHEQNLEDQNKGDGLLKALAVLQVLWLIITLIIRAARHLPSSQLELLVAAFSGCAFVIYVLFWNKSKDVSTTRYITAVRYPTQKEILEIALEGPSTLFHYRKGYWIPNNAVHRMGKKPSVGAAGNESSENDKLDSQPRRFLLIGSVLGAVIFGAPQLAAWYFVFPTPVERVLWRIAAIMTVFLPPMGTLIVIAYRQLYNHVAKHSIKVGEPPGDFQARCLKSVSKLILVFALPYLLARLYIFVEVFRCLCYLPPEAFLTTWATNVPHIN